MLRLALATLLSTVLLSPFSFASEINISGSTSVAHIMDVLAEEYNNANPGTFIAVQGVGSTAGITLLKKGVADIAMASRYLTENEEEDALSSMIIAFDGMAVVVNQKNPVQNLTRQQLYDIYKGKITNWKDVGAMIRKSRWSPERHHPAPVSALKACWG